VTIFGPLWPDLALSDIASFLNGTESEGLLWEAKGVDAKPHEVRRQVCGFANSHEGGYLIIGASQASDGSWTLDGVAFPDEPPTWVANIIGEGGVNPYPEGLDVRSWPTSDGRQVAVVEVPPLAAPPCNTSGIVYERVSGRTITVRDPTRLAELFARGEDARRGAETVSAQAASGVLRIGTAHPLYQERHVQFGLGLAASGYAPDISSRLFSHGFEQGVRSSMLTSLEQDPLQPPSGTPIGRETSQEAVVFVSHAADPVMGYSWVVRCVRDGSVGIYWLQGVQQSSVESIVKGPLVQAWKSAEEILSMLEPQGPRYLRALVAGGSFPANSVIRGAPAPTTVSRGPVDPGFDATVLASIERELIRALGGTAYE
jgi:hypothetical protein